MTDIFWAAFGGGLAVGLFALLVAFIIWIRWYKNRPTVNIRVSWAYYWDVLNPVTHRHIILTASNPHSKPITLQVVGFEIKDSAEVIHITHTEPYSLPYELLEGQSFTTLCSPSDIVQLLQVFNRKPSELSYAFFATQMLKRSRCKLSRRFIKNLQVIYNTIYDGKLE